MLVLTLARFVLTLYNIFCPEVSAHPFIQLIGTTMGTSFAVIYANILVFLIETEISSSFNTCYHFSFRKLDDGVILYSGSDEEFLVFMEHLILLSHYEI